MEAKSAIAGNNTSNQTNAGLRVDPPNKSDEARTVGSSGPVSLKILLAGSSGVPGRNILTSLLELKKSEPSLDLKISILKRSATRTSGQPENESYGIVYVDEFSHVSALSHILESENPDVIVSALNAEPAPVLDNYLIDAISGVAAFTTTKPRKPVFFINGFTLDLLHPSAAASLPESALQTLSGKIDFAKRLQALSHSNDIEYCTVVNASFLDYCLVKGYIGVDLGSQVVTLVDDGDFVLTGCSLKFVGDAVAQIVRQYTIGSNFEKQEVVNKRVRIAETPYSGKLLLETVEKVTGQKFVILRKNSTTLLESGSVVGYLNWSKNGCSTFLPDGMDFGKGSTLKRRSLEEIARTAIEGGRQAFEGIGR